MPRLRQMPSDVIKGKDRLFKWTVLRYMDEQNITRPELCSLLGISISTLKNRLMSAKLLTWEQEKNLVETLKIPKDEWDACRYI